MIQKQLNFEKLEGKKISRALQKSALLNDAVPGD